MELEKLAELEPGKTYVVEVEKRFKSDEDFQKFLDHLKRQAPECKFLVLDGGARIARFTSEETEKPAS